MDSLLKQPLTYPPPRYGHCQTLTRSLLSSTSHCNQSDFDFGHLQSFISFCTCTISYHRLVFAFSVCGSSQYMLFIAWLQLPTDTRLVFCAAGYALIFKVTWAQLLFLLASQSCRDSVPALCFSFTSQIHGSSVTSTYPPIYIQYIYIYITRASKCTRIYQTKLFTRFSQVTTPTRHKCTRRCECMK